VDDEIEALGRPLRQIGHVAENGLQGEPIALGDHAVLRELSR
jgi:hypothetical protein